jgi:hypothetical protein
MPFRTVIEPEAIEMLERILHEHCGKFGIRTAEGTESVATSILSIYQGGIRDPQTIAALIEKEDRPRL